ARYVAELSQRAAVVERDFERRVGVLEAPGAKWRNAIFANRDPFQELLRRRTHDLRVAEGRQAHGAIEESGRNHVLAAELALEARLRVVMDDGLHTLRLDTYLDRTNGRGGNPSGA